MRGIFFDEEAAVAVERRLLAGGYAAQVLRERLAGEDDDEDHQWAVLTDAPEVVLEVLVDQFDGWLDLAEPEAGRGGEVVPLELPEAPRRVHRKDG